MTVRLALARDFEGIANILNTEITEGYAHFGTEELTAADVQAEWESQKDSYPMYVAEHAGEVVGFCRASPWKSRGAYRWSVEIGVYVAPAWQGKGVGRMLYEHLFPTLREMGYKTIIAGVSLPNEASVALHESFGMRHAGTLPAVGFKHGCWRDVGYWVKRIGLESPPR